MTDFDVIIVGGGLVGLATACALSKTTMNIAIIDAKPDIYQSLSVDQCTIRASAINLASKHYFEQIGIWQNLNDSGRVLSFDSIDVFEKQGIAKLQAESIHYQYPNLGYIIENQLMLNMSYTRVIKQSNVHLLQERVDELFFTGDRGFIHLDSGKKISAKLIIGADGVNSLIRQTQQIKLLQYPYRHDAIIATVKTSSLHQACARQIFYNDGIIAYLPLWQQDMSCLVWSTKPQSVAELLSQDTVSFSQQLAQMSEHCLGDCQLVSERLVFPLVARFCPKPIKDRLILIGDAAHTIHPLAGQGVNLGLADSKLLVDVISQNYLQHNDFGLQKTFYTYQLRRHKETVIMMTAMQGIQETFNGESSVKRLLRGAGMNMINASPFVKKQLIKHALGL